jgi:lipase chaperone LimK
VSRQARRWALTGGLVLLLGGGFAWQGLTTAGPGGVVLAPPGAVAGVALDAARDASPVAPQPAPAAAGSAALAHWVQTLSVLRGTALDGGWGMDAAGALQPTLALRRRFDHVLQLQGQLSLAQISRYLRELAADDLNPAQTDAVMAVWERYLSLQQTTYASVVRLDDPDSLAPALAERQQARRQWLGPAWAQAFYGDEEAALTELILRPAAPAPAMALIDRSALSAAAQQRLAAEEARQADFQHKLTQARAALPALQQAPELSAPQRQQAVQAWLDQHFDAAEQRRVRALLALPPS